MNFRQFQITIVIYLMVLLTSSCTLSFQNVMSSGDPSDFIDSNPDVDAQVDGQLTIPIKAI